MSAWTARGCGVPDEFRWLRGARFVCGRSAAMGNPVVSVTELCSTVSMYPPPWSRDNLKAVPPSLSRLPPTLVASLW